MAFFYLPIQQQLSLIKKLIANSYSTLSASPPGRLTVQRSHGHIQYLHRPSEEGKKREYICKKRLPFARSLAQKEYTETFPKTALVYKETLQKLLSEGCSQSASNMYHALSDPYESLSPERKALVTPYVLSDNAFIQSFLETSYEKKGFADGSPVIRTQKGERVRSKSEKIIADKLDHMGIPYLYEYPLFLRRYGWIDPDFTLLDIRERSTVILEHFGLMQDPSYVTRSVKKLEDYVSDGYFPGDSLLVTYEGGTHVLDVEYLERLLNYRFFS